MSDNILITTTVSLGCAGNANQMVIHLVQGDYGTRALRLIPVDSGKLMDMDAEGVVQAKVRLACAGHEDLLIDCELGDRYATLVPTKAMTSGADTWQAQLVLLDDNNMTVSTAPFTVVVHGTVYNGDAVEHTNSAVTAAAYDAQGRLVLQQLNGNEVVAADFTNLVSAIQTALADYLLTAQDRTDINTIKGYLNQSVKTDAEPRFEGLQIGGTWNASTGKWQGGVSISSSGEIDGAVFT